MVVKYKIGFEMSGETLFSLIAKFLPVDNLSVEEVMINHPPPQPHPPRLTAKKPHINKRRGDGPNLERGINQIIVEALHEKPHRAGDLRPLLKARGYSPQSVNSRIEDLRNHGVIEVTNGVWRLKKQSA